MLIRGVLRFVVLTRVNWRLGREYWHTLCFSFVVERSVRIPAQELQSRGIKSAGTTSAVSCLSQSQISMLSNGDLKNELRFGQGA
jgi:hypothetical protein